jgi:hypothetical protein
MKKNFFQNFFLQRNLKRIITNTSESHACHFHIDFFRIRRGKFFRCELSLDSWTVAEATVDGLVLLIAVSSFPFYTNKIGGVCSQLSTTVDNCVCNYFPFWAQFFNELAVLLCPSCGIKR